MNTLEQFLKYGDLGPIRVGMGADELMRALGPPDERPAGKNPRILKYGDLQVIVTRSPDRDGDRVAAIGLYFQPQESGLPEAVQPVDWVPSGSTTEAEFRSYLDRIGYPPYSSVDGESGSHLVLSSGASVTFDNSRLHAIQYTLRGPGQRRVAITLPDELYELLRDAARDSRRTVSELCTEWLVEKANTIRPQPAGTHHAI